MQDATPFSLVMVTAPDLETARKLVRGALEAKLAACGNIVPGIESHYYWEGKLEQTAEALILFKTLKSSLSDLETYLEAAHPYDTPEVITFDLANGSAKYLNWILNSQR